jgi:hypothetical protein
MRFHDISSTFVVGLNLCRLPDGSIFIHQSDYCDYCEKILTPIHVKTLLNQETLDPSSARTLLLLNTKASTAEAESAGATIVFMNGQAKFYHDGHLKLVGRRISNNLTIYISAQ